MKIILVNLRKILKDFVIYSIHIHIKRRKKVSNGIKLLFSVWKPYGGIKRKYVYENIW
jgi:hypothetical protein